MSLHEPVIRVPLVDDQTLEILARRRSVATPRRRGWVVRRMLLLADVFGLTVAFLVAQAIEVITWGLEWRSPFLPPASRDVQVALGIVDPPGSDQWIRLA